MAITITIEPKGFAEAARALAGIENGFPRAAADSINRALLAGRTLTAKLVRSRYNISAAALKSQMEMKKASFGDLSGSLGAKGPMLPVSLFKPTIRRKQIRRRGPSAQFVSVSIIKGSKKLVKGAFQAKGRIWERRGPERDARLGIVSTIGIPFMVSHLDISKPVQEKMAEVAKERLAHNVNRLLAVRGGAK